MGGKGGGKDGVGCEGGLGAGGKDEVGGEGAEQRGGQWQSSGFLLTNRVPGQVS